MANKRTMRGLDSIFEENTVDNNNQVLFIEINSVTPKKNQPRKYFDNESLTELAASIATHGVIQPIIVRDIKNGSYEIIAGERRWRASKQAGLSEIPCIIIEADEFTAAQFALIENIQREDLNAFEEAQAYKSLIEDFSLSQEEVSKKVGKSRSAIANSMRLLDLPDEILDLLLKNELSAGHCRTLLGLKDRSKMLPLATRIIKRNLTVREVEAAVRKQNKETDEYEREDDSGEIRINYYEELNRRATELSGRKIKVSSGKNKQYIQIEYTNDDDLEGLLVKLCGKEIIE